jgi:hypothetical protein
MLQRVPPDIKILTPSFRFFSSSKTFSPRAPALAAAINPAAPAPMMTKSKWGILEIDTAPQTLCLAKKMNDPNSTRTFFAINLPFQP